MIDALLEESRRGDSRNGVFPHYNFVSGRRLSTLHSHFEPVNKPCYFSGIREGSKTDVT